MVFCVCREIVEVVKEEDKFVVEGEVENKF